VLLPLCVGVLITACEAAAPRDEAATEGFAAADRAAYEVTIERLEGEVRSLHAQVAELQGRLEDVDLGIRCQDYQDRIALLEVELQRYRDGLGRAVAELNQRPSASPTPAAPTEWGSVHAFSPPKVERVGDSVVLSGRVYSSFERTKTVRLTLYLVHEGRDVSHRSQVRRIGAKTAIEYSETWSHTPGAGYSGRLELEVFKQ
jgi:hypothetical protein